MSSESTPSSDARLVEAREGHFGSRVPGAPDERESQYRAVEGGNDIASGPTLLVEAYAAIWLVLLGFLLLSWRRQSRINAKMAELERIVSEARRGGG